MEAVDGDTADAGNQRDDESAAYPVLSTVVLEESYELAGGDAANGSAV